MIWFFIKLLKIFRSTKRTISSWSKQRDPIKIHRFKSHKVSPLWRSWSLSSLNNYQKYLMNIRWTKFRFIPVQALMKFVQRYDKTSFSNQVCCKPSSCRLSKTSWKSTKSCKNFNKRFRTSKQKKRILKVMKNLNKIKYVKKWSVYS